MTATDSTGMTGQHAGATGYRRRHLSAGGSVVKRLTALWRHTTAQQQQHQQQQHHHHHSQQPPAAGLTDAERYWFDVQGFVVIPGVISCSQVTACNASLEAHRERVEYTPLSENGRGWVVPPPLAGSSPQPGRSQLSHTMQLPSPHCQPFREAFLNEKALGCMHGLIGVGFRGTEGRVLLTSEGAEGHALHSGGTTRDASEEDSTLALGGHMSLCQNGKLWNAVVSVQYALSAVHAGDGGFCVIPGSHKSNWECPRQVRACEIGSITQPGQLVQPVMQPGDMLLFTEAVTHGTLPWVAQHERRTLMFRYISPLLANHAQDIPLPEDRDAFVHAAVHDA
jgi:hypothetical protein